MRLPISHLAGFQARHSIYGRMVPRTTGAVQCLSKGLGTFNSSRRLAQQQSLAKPLSIVSYVQRAPGGEDLTVDFHDASFKFHSQWLHDAQVDKGPSKGAGDVFTQKTFEARIQKCQLTGAGARSIVNVTWSDGSTSLFPSSWLRVLAPLVAQKCSTSIETKSGPLAGWLARDLIIPEVPYSEIFPSGPKESILDAILQANAAGIIKVVGLPTPDFEGERSKENTIVTKVLKELFGSVFFHSRRGADKTFNVASHQEEDKKRGTSLPNYDTNRVLLPHADHAHYTHPARVQGLYCLEGESQNTFVSCHAVLETLKQEAPHLYQPFCSAPMATGRVAHYYKPSLYQATTDTAVTKQPGFPDQIKRFRWHPHLTGSLLSPYEDFQEARLAFRAFQEIMGRDSHLFRFNFKPGDLYIWDNARILHGRQSVLPIRRTAVGQTVSEEVVYDRYRTLKIDKLKDFVDHKWLVHVPLQQLHEMVKLVGKAEPGL